MINIGKRENYTLGQYNVTLPAGVTRVTFNVSITNDDVLEVNEKFDLIIDLSSVSSSNVNVGSNYKTTVLIVDDDGKCNINM